MALAVTMGVGAVLERLSINLTHFCNLDCVYCYALGGNYGGDSRHLVFDDSLEKIRDIAVIKNGIKMVQFFGGEPLIRHEYISRYIDFFSRLVDQGILEKRPKYSVVTNLTLLTSEIIELVNIHDIQCIVSIDGPPDITNVTRPSKNGKKVGDLIQRNVIALKENNIRFDVEATFTKQHHKYGYTVLNILQYFEEYAPSSIKIVNAAHEDDEIGFNTLVDAERIISEHQEALEYCFDSLEDGKFVPYGIFIEMLESVLRQPDRTEVRNHGCGDGGCNAFCTAGSENLAIAANNKIYACHMFSNNPEYELQVEDGEIRFINNEIVTKSDFEECQACWAKKWCVACPGAMEFQSKGRPAPSYTHCEMTRRMLLQTFSRYGVSRFAETHTAVTNSGTTVN